MRIRSLPFAVLLTCLATVCADDRQPIPEQAAQDEAISLVEEVFGDDLAKAETPEEKIALIKRLLEHVGPARISENRFALYKTALDVAPNARIAVSVIDDMAKHFEFDVLQAMATTIVKLSKTAKSSEEHQALVEESLKLVDGYIIQDEFAAASRLLDIALEAAKRSRDRNLIRAARDRAEQVADLRKGFQKVQTAMAVLQTDPTDPSANDVVGSYKCFIKGDWEGGLPMLALGSDEPLKAIATQELREVDSIQDKVQLADGWWELSQSRDEAEKEMLMRRAGFWYRQARAEIKQGLTAAKIDKRLTEIEAMGEVRESTQENPTTANAKPRRLSPGLVLRVFPQQDVQDGNRYAAQVMPSQFGQPLGRPTLIGQSIYDHDKSTNAIAFGYLKIPVEGDYVFQTTSGYDRAALYINAKVINPFRDGEGKQVTLHLEPGTIPIAIVGWTVYTSVRTHWTPPGATEPTIIPTRFLFHDPKQPVPIVVEEPDGVGHLPVEVAGQK